MIQSFKSGVGEYALLVATFSQLLIVIFALFRDVKEFVRRPSIVEWFMSKYAVVPVMVFKFVFAEFSFIPV